MDYFEDFSVNQRFTFGRYTVTRDEIVDFATQYDPQAFHTEENDPLSIELGGIMAVSYTHLRAHET